MKKYKETKRSITLRDVSPWILTPRLAALNWLFHRYAEPAVSAAQDITRKNIVVPIEKKLGIKPQSRIRTEHDLSTQFLNTLDSINVSQLDRQVPDWRERTEKGDTVRIGVTGNNYTPNYGGTKVSRRLRDRLTNPLFQIETTLGSYRVQATKDDIITTDDYDWNTKVHLNQNSTYGFLRELMNQYGTPEDAPEGEKIKFNIKSKRKK